MVVVGGGAAGLSGALALGRSRRRVLVVDGGEPRNAPAGHVHNYLGREGVPPAELLSRGRAEVNAYGVEVVDDTVAQVRATDGTDIGFVVTTVSQREVTARRVLVAGGVVDELPDLPGLQERWGRDVLHCPYCHGWEVRDQAIAVLASSPLAAHQALLFRQLSDDVVVVPTAEVTLADADLEQLSALGVRVLADTPTEVVVAHDRLVGLRFASGEIFERDALVVSPVAGVYAAGNAADIVATVVASAAAGLRVGAMINGELATEDARAAVAQRHADFFERPAWEQRYGEQEPVWSGQVNAQLAAEVTGLSPGRALDAGSGEGADAIWLARRRWRVTGLEFAAAGRARAAEHAEQARVADSVEWRDADLRVWEPGEERWDLVTSQFMHLPDGGMFEVTRQLADAVSPGGTLLVVGHHPDDLATGLRHGQHSHMFTPQDLRAALDPEVWEVQVCEVRSRTTTHARRDGVVELRDSVLRARRLDDR